MIEPSSPPSVSDSAEEFVKLMAVHQPRIFSFVLALLPNVADAEEVMQETSLVLWRRFSEFQPGSNFRAWACQVAKFKVLEFRRANPRHVPIELSDEHIERIADLAIQKADTLELRRLALFDCVQKLAGRDRDLIERRVRSGSTVPQISRETGRPVAGLYKAYERIYRALQSCIDRAVAKEAR